VRIRIALVDYLNSAPLGWFFLHGPLQDRFEVLPATPALCADLLRRREVHAGIIPSIEYQRIPGLRLVPGVAVASSSRVRSVVMVRHPGREIRSVALDTSSRTSVVLLKILLAERYGIRPEFVSHAPDPEAMMAAHDAALVIGDAALKLPLDRYEVVDLAEAWIGWQSRPFVFAVWACVEDPALPPDLASLFREAKEWGLARREEVAANYAQRLGLPMEFLLKYLIENIDYRLDRQHQEGLEMFYSLADRGGFIKNPVPLRFLSVREGVSADRSR
jgi:chorismate dehydratase